MNRVRLRTGKGFPARRRTHLGETDREAALRKRELRRKGLDIAAAGHSAAGSVVSAIPAAPWTQIVGAGLIATGAAIKLVNQIASRGSRALAGDTSAVAGFAKRAAKWSAAKRKRKAERYLKRYEKFKGRKQSRIRVQKKLAIYEMKLQVLYALEAKARGLSKKKSTASKSRGSAQARKSSERPRRDQRQQRSERPAGVLGVSPTVLIGGAVAAAAVVGLALVRSGR